MLSIIEHAQNRGVRGENSRHPFFENTLSVFGIREDTASVNATAGGASWLGTRLARVATIYSRVVAVECMCGIDGQISAMSHRRNPIRKRTMCVGK